MRPSLEPLERRDCAAPLTPGHVVQGAATDCTFLALLAGAAAEGVDLQSRLHHVGPHRWRVDLYRSNGTPASVPVRDDWLTPLDPAVIAGDRRPLLFARAHRALAPWIGRGQGESLEVASGILFGRLPERDDGVRLIGLQAIRAALMRGSAVVCCSDYHAYAVLRVTDSVVTLYDPWGIVRRMPASAFLRKPFEVAVVAAV